MMHGSILTGAALVGLGVAGTLGMHAVWQPAATPSTQPAPGAGTPAPGAPSGQPGATPGAAPAGASGGVNADMVKAMIEGLKTTPGCLGVEVAMTPSRKQVIFAWFKDKASVMAWYNSPAHMAAVDAVMPGRDKTRTPMANVPDEGPIMATASMTMGPGGFGLAIDLYSPLTGGLRLGNGGFAPAAFSELVNPKAEGGAPVKK